MSDLVLVTGISGFLGGHIALQLLRAGYRVLGSVRNIAKADAVRQALSSHGADVSRLDFVELDLLSDRGWTDAMSGVRSLQHVASPLVANMSADKMELIRPAVEGTRRALEAAFTAGVDRIVLTSSVATIAYGHDKSRTAPFTAADWTDPKGRPINAYTESKLLAEREAWAIADRHGRKGALAAINPAVVLGPLLDDDPGTSVTLVSSLLKGALPMVPRIAFGITDVRDVAALHVAAMTDPNAGGHRFPIASGSYSLWELTKLLREVTPVHAARKLPRVELPDWVVRTIALFSANIRNQTTELGMVKHIDGSDAKRLLGRSFIPIRETVDATVASLIARKLI